MPTTHTRSASRQRLRQAFSVACRLSGPLQVSATHRGSGRHQTFLVRRPYATVGRGAANDIRLTDPSVSRAHAYLQVVEGGVYCADLGSRTGVVWDDGRCGPGWVCGGKSVRVGAFDLKVGTPHSFVNRQAASAGAGTPDGPTSHLPAAALDVYRASDTPVGSCPLDWPVTLVGRHPACRLRFVDSTVEYFQGCVVSTTDGVWWLNFSPRRTSLVNGQRARLSRLEDGDILEFGRVRLVPRKANVADQADGPLVELTATTAVVPPLGHLCGPASAVGAMVAEFRQCVTAMAQSFAALQREHAAAVSDHLRQIQELTREIRQLRGEGGVSAPSNAVHVLPPQPPPTPRLSSDADKASLSDAHAWFLGLLATLDPSTATGSKRPS